MKNEGLYWGDLAVHGFRLNLKSDIKNQETERDNLTRQFMVSQAAFLDKYFTKINEIFKDLGSKDFLIERVEPDNRGYKKIYGISVKYKGKPIKEDDLQFVFSESDKRALALSIFWAKVLLKSEEALSKTIIILDDPVTSFDDNRISYSIGLIGDVLDKARQIIVLTHYPNLIKRFCETKKGYPCEFLNICRDDKTSFIDKCNKNEFILSAHQKVFFEIYDYINRKPVNNDDIYLKLRIFMENQLKLIFYMAIKEYNLDKIDLKALIEGLEGNAVIDSAVAKTLHNFRDKLNSGHHVYTSRNEEDIRKDASDLLELMFSVKLNPKQFI